MEHKFEFEDEEEELHFVQPHPRIPVQLTTIMSCKYLLPCGKCDKTDEMCSQYMEIKIDGSNTKFG